MLDDVVDFEALEHKAAAVERVRRTLNCMVLLWYFYGTFMEAPEYILEYIFRMCTLVYMPFIMMCMLESQS